MKLLITTLYLLLTFKFMKKAQWLWGPVLMFTYSFSYMNSYKINKYIPLENFMVLLTLWLFFVTLVLTYQETHNSKGLLALMNALMLITMAFFLIDNIMYMYVFFEMSIMPIFMIILIWGYQTERLFASLSIFMYTFLASLPLLFTIIYLEQMSGVHSMTFLVLNSTLAHPANIWLPITLSLAFLVKTPIYLTHMWLPKAHVEAPVFGSMVLASILLKMGTYGFLYFNTTSMMSTFKWTLFSTGMWGMTVIALMCFKITNMKVLVAYSSVSHMAFLISVTLLNSELSILSSMLMMLTHGFSSSALFFYVNIMYENSNSQNLIMNKGIQFPSTLFLMWSIIIMSNISTPPTMNFMAELLGVFSMVLFNTWAFMLITIFMITTTLYSYFMFSAASQLETNFSSLLTTQKKNYLISLVHILPISLLIINMSTTI